MASDEYFDANDRKLFKDTDHLNTAGAEAFSYLFGQIINGQILAEDVFYDTYDAKLEDEAAMVYGLSKDPNGNCQIILNRKEGLEYKIIAYPDGGEAYYIQDYANERMFNLHENESGTIEVIWRESTAKDVENSLEADH